VSEAVLVFVAVVVVVACVRLFAENMIHNGRPCDVGKVSSDQSCRVPPGGCLRPV
jgi:hypothetical protein